MATDATMARTEPEVHGSQELPLAPDDVGVAPTTPAIKWLRTQPWHARSLKCVGAKSYPYNACTTTDTETQRQSHSHRVTETNTHTNTYRLNTRRTKAIKHNVKLKTCCLLKTVRCSIRQSMIQNYCLAWQVNEHNSNTRRTALVE